MNTFNFIGTISNTNNLIKNNNNGTKQLIIKINQNKENSAYVQLFGDKLYNGEIPVFSNDRKRISVKYENRNNPEILSKISNYSKYIIENNHERYEYIWKDDFINKVAEIINNNSSNTIYEISGEYVVSIYKNKFYNNFNIKSIKVNNSLRPELKMSLDLFYNYKSLDETDKKNKFILNAFIEQYVYADKKREYFPLQVQFITNRFDFKNITHIEVIKHRKSNMNPTEEEGYVQAKWEAQYVKGAQLILPPLETLPKDIQFEIINAGRDIKEYMNNVVGEASEFICLTRPDNTKDKDGKVYIPLKCTENEFKSKINKSALEILENEKNLNKSIDEIAKKDASENPFN